MLAERSRVSATLFAVALVAAASLFIVKPQSEEPVTGVVTIENHVVVTGPGLVRVADCPAHVLQALQLNEYNAVICAKGRFPEPATFAIAYYQTTEWWERLA